MQRVEADGVAGAALTDRVAGVPDRDADQVAQVVAGGVGADEVLEDRRTRPPRADRDAGAGVVPDEVPVASCRAADCVVRAGDRDT